MIKDDPQLRYIVERVRIELLHTRSLLCQFQKPADPGRPDGDEVTLLNSVDDLIRACNAGIFDANNLLTKLD